MHLLDCLQAILFICSKSKMSIKMPIIMGTYFNSVMTESHWIKNSPQLKDRAYYYWCTLARYISMLNCFCWSYYCCISPCHWQLLKEDVDSWSYTSPPASMHIDVLAEDGPDTAPTLKYYSPVSGIIPEDTSSPISQQLQLHYIQECLYILQFFVSFTYRHLSATTTTGL